MRLLVAVLALVLAVPAGAVVRPEDQALAERLTLRLGDVPNGWTVHARPKVRKSPCFPEALRTARTGFAVSADFQGTNEAQQASSQTAVYPTVALAKRAYDRVLSSRYANCVLSGARRQVRGSSKWRKARVAFRPDCGYGTRCGFVAGEWRVSFELQRVAAYIDYVIVRKDRAIIIFVFSDVLTPPSSYMEETMVKAVAAR